MVFFGFVGKHLRVTRLSFFELETRRSFRSGGEKRPLRVARYSTLPCLTRSCVVRVIQFVGDSCRFKEQREARPADRQQDNSRPIV